MSNSTLTNQRNLVESTSTSLAAKLSHDALPWFHRLTKIINDEARQCSTLPSINSTYLEAAWQRFFKQLQFIILLTTSKLTYLLPDSTLYSIELKEMTLTMRGSLSSPINKSRIGLTCLLVGTSGRNENVWIGRMTEQNT